MKLHNMILFGLTLVVLSGMPTQAAWNPKITSVKTYRKVNDVYVEDDVFWNRDGVAGKMEDVYIGIEANDMPIDIEWAYSIKCGSNDTGSGLKRYPQKAQWAPPASATTADGKYLITENVGTHRITARIPTTGTILTSMEHDMMLVDLKSLVATDAITVGGSYEASAIIRPLTVVDPPNPAIPGRTVIWELLDPSNIGVTFADGTTSATTTDRSMTVKAGNAGGNYFGFVIWVLHFPQCAVM